MGMKESIKNPLVLILIVLVLIIVMLIIMDVVLHRKIAQGMCLIVADWMSVPGLRELGIRPLKTMCLTLLPF